MAFSFGVGSLFERNDELAPFALHAYHTTGLENDSHKNDDSFPLIQLCQNQRDRQPIFFILIHLE